MRGWQSEDEKVKASYHIAKENWDESVKIGSPAIEPLINVLKNESSHLWGGMLLGHEYDIHNSAAEALVKIGKPSVEPLILVLKDSNYLVQRITAETLEKIGDQRAIPALMALLTDWHSNYAAANALQKLGWQPQSVNDKVHYALAKRDKSDLIGMWEQTKSVLLKDVLSSEYRVVENALYAFIAIGNQEIIPTLITTLDLNGNKTMAEVYLNCGHEPLNSAARAWAARNGYIVTTGSGASPVTWGSWR